MAKHQVLLLGATGETGGDILEGLLEDGNFDVACLVQPASSTKSSVQALSTRGLKIVVGDLSSSVEDLAALIKPYDTIISAIGPTQQGAQLTLVDAAAKVGTKRFVPCGFTTVCPPGGIMHIRDDKEEVYQQIWKAKVPYTIIDVGYWHQISWPRVPSGRLDYALLAPQNEIYGDGEAKTLLTDKRDIGRFVARIVKDERTLNKWVFTYSDALSQNQITEIVERKSGEKLQLTHVSAQAFLQRLEKARVEAAQHPTDNLKRVTKSQAEYVFSKFIRKDNILENAKYLGYLDARELYPDFKPIGFEEFVGELFEGKGVRPYVGKY